MSEAYAEDGLRSQRCTEEIENGRDKYSVVFSVLQNLFFRKQVPPENPLFHTESETPALRKTNLELQSGFEGGTPRDSEAACDLGNLLEISSRI
jgi:hypothetical protein